MMTLISVPPGEAVILDEKGMVAGDSVSGYHEGSTLVLTCDIIGGMETHSGLRLSRVIGA